MINRFETPPDGQIAAARNRSPIENAAIGISRFLWFV